MTAIHYLSFDVEDWFQVPFVDSAVSRESWDSQPSIVEEGCTRFLDLLDGYNAKATFFGLGWVAEKYPGIYQEIAARGHEIATHGYGHEPLDRLTPEQFKADLDRSLEAITRACGVTPKGYRAPVGSIGKDTVWALDVLSKTGIEYDSSIYPSGPMVYAGLKDSRQSVYEIREDLWEIPLSAEKVLGLSLPVSGGFYLRFYPFSIFKALLKNRTQRGESAVLYFHPWEFCTDYPRVARNPLKRFIQYYNLESVIPKLDELLQTYTFSPLHAALPAK